MNSALWEETPPNRQSLYIAPVESLDLGKAQRTSHLSSVEEESETATRVLASKANSRSPDVVSQGDEDAVNAME
jgi:hypothetical protein